MVILDVLLPALGYLLGSIPSGVLLGRLVGRDPRAGGSGNIGASNVTRTLGRKLGAVTLLLDLAKGALPVALARWLAGVDVAAAAGVLAVVGHCYPIWLRFRGGKGVATTFGVLLVFAPVVAVIGALAWIGLVFFTRIPTIGSVVAASLFVVLVRFDGQPFSVQVMTLLIFVVILVRHASNLRVLKGRYQQQRARRANRQRKRPRRRR